jgi:methionyl-tRNA formyltransferase
MKLVFWGTPDFAVPTLERLLQEGQFEVLGVVTQPDKRRGRGNQLSPSAVKALALAHNVPVWQPHRVKKDLETLSELRSLQADAFVVVAYGQLLSPEILAMPRLGCINSHGSLLPKYRGAAPIQWALYHGELATGITTMQMDVGMDTGAVLLQRRLSIGLWDNAQDLTHSLSQVSAELMVDTLLQLEAQQLQPLPQDAVQATYAPLIQKADYQLDWSKSAIALHNQIRGFIPNCVTQLREQSLKVIATAPLESTVFSFLPEPLQEVAAQVVVAPQCAPGTVLQIVKHWGPIVQTGTGGLLLQSVQLAGKRCQSGWDFANGLRLSVGEVLGKIRP